MAIASILALDSLLITVMVWLILRGVLVVYVVIPGAILVAFSGLGLALLLCDS